MTITFTLIDYINKFAEEFKATGNINYEMLGDIVLEAKDNACEDICASIRKFCLYKISDQQMIDELLTMVPSES